jgi:general secretion pathway protein I
VSGARTRGFTLIEVLVALAIAAIGLAAVLAVVTNSARNSVYLRDKTFASWIAQNRITELRLGTTMPSVDKTNGDLEFAGQKWKWEQTVTQTDVAGMRRIDVAVRFADAPVESPLATVTGFVGRTQLAAPPSGASWDIQAAGNAPGTSAGATTGTTTGTTTGAAPGPQPPATGGTSR